jgi:ribose-phosphate pyrophosphokinase
MFIIGCSNSITLSESLSTLISFEGIEYASSAKFADGELKLSLDYTRYINKQVCILQSGYPNPNEAMIELLLVVGGIKRAGASKIIAIIPYFPYVRQGWQRAGILLEAIKAAGADIIITLDLHEDLPLTMPEVRHISASSLFANYIKHRYSLKDVLIVSPDEGGEERAKQVAKQLNLPFIALKKTRDSESGQVTVVTNQEIASKLNKKHCILIDDIVNSAASILAAAKQLWANGAIQVEACVTHPLLTRLPENAQGDLPIVVTDSVSLSATLSETIEVISIAPLLAKVINKE